VYSGLVCFFKDARINKLKIFNKLKDMHADAGVIRPARHISRHVIQQFLMLLPNSHMIATRMSFDQASAGWLVAY
jgi:hypothetical protein